MPRPSLDDLDMAYLDGHRSGLSGHPFMPPQDEILAAGWEAGWRDGTEQRRLRRVWDDTPYAWQRFPPLLEAYISNRSSRPPLAKPDFSLRMQRWSRTTLPARCATPAPQPMPRLSVRISNKSARPPLSRPDFGLRMQRLALPGT